MLYLHNYSDNCTDWTELSDEVVRYRGLDLLIVQCQDLTDHPNIENVDPNYPDRYVEIAGILSRYKYDRTAEDSGLVYSEVKPFKVSDDKSKAELEKIIRDAGFKGPISGFNKNT